MCEKYLGVRKEGVRHYMLRAHGVVLESSQKRRGETS
jgi:hypothetical protein